MYAWCDVSCEESKLIGSHSEIESVFKSMSMFVLVVILFQIADTTESNIK